MAQPLAKAGPAPKAWACDGRLLRWPSALDAPQGAVRLRGVEGRPVSAITPASLAWSCRQLTARGTRALRLLWDNASWHRSPAARPWSRAHDHQVKREQPGVRIVVGPWPTTSPGLTPLEAHGVHGKRGVAEAEGLLPAWESADRGCAYCQWAHDPHLAMPEKVA